MKRILFTSVGRRVELVQAFYKAAERLKYEVWIIGVDADPTAPGLFICDERIKICNIRDNKYISELLKICRYKKIDIVIPTIDTDLYILSRNRENFAKIGTEVLISNPDKIQICRDKSLTYHFFLECGLKSPETFSKIEEFSGSFPCFIKPKDGSSSINAYRVKNREELLFFSERIKDYVIQSYIDGEEYTVDIMCDFLGQPIYIVPRKRISVRSGEVLKTEISLNKKIINEVHKLLDKFRPCGPITVQLIQEESTGDNFYIEINPRFGGGAPLSMKAGADSAGALLELLHRKALSFANNEVNQGLLFSRYDQSICVTYQTREIEYPSIDHYLPEDRIKAIILDLDDTLYWERDYVKSGFNAIASNFPEYPELFGILWDNFQSGKAAIDESLKKINCFSEKLKLRCLDIYRNHEPELSLLPSHKKKLEEWKERGIQLGLISDGDPGRQKKKIRALGLEELIPHIIITDALGGPSFRKPCDISFRIMQKKLDIPFQDMIYIGDNKKKDFKAPKTLGMQYVCIQNPNGLYYDKNRVADANQEELDMILQGE